MSVTKHRVVHRTYSAATTLRAYIYDKGIILGSMLADTIYVLFSVSTDVKMLSRLTSNVAAFYSLISYSRIRLWVFLAARYPFGPATSAVDSLSLANGRPWTTHNPPHLPPRRRGYIT